MTTPPFEPLMIDKYALDAPSDFNELSASGQYFAVTLKATEGLSYSSDAAPTAGWLTKNWQALAATRTFRQGAIGEHGLIRGAYHYARFNESGKAQAQYYIAAVAKAGGFASGDLWPIIDAESADNEGATASQVEDCVSEFAEEIMVELGKLTMFYGGSLPYDLGITSRMGCSWLWFPRYTATLDEYTYERIGWNLGSLFSWQYSDGDVSYLETPNGVLYPKTAPGCGACDHSVLTFPGGLPALQAALA